MTRPPQEAVSRRNSVLQRPVITNLLAASTASVRGWQQHLDVAFAATRSPRTRDEQLHLTNEPTPPDRSHDGRPAPSA